MASTSFPDQPLQLLRETIDDLPRNVNLTELCEKAIRSIFEENNEEVSSPLVNAIRSVLCEAARRDLSGDDLGRVLMGYDSSFVTKIIAVYTREKEKLRCMMKTIGWHPGQIVNFEWKISRKLESNVMGHSADTICDIHLNVLQSDARHSEIVSFQCNSDQLTEMVRKLKEAQHAMKNLSPSQ